MSKEALGRSSLHIRHADSCNKWAIQGSGWIRINKLLGHLAGTRQLAGLLACTLHARTSEIPGHCVSPQGVLLDLEMLWRRPYLTRQIAQNALKYYSM